MLDAQACRSGLFAVELDPYAPEEVTAFVIESARECGLIGSLNDAEVFFLPNGKTLVPESMGGAAAVAQMEARAAASGKPAPEPKLSEVRKTFNVRMKQILEANGFRKVAPILNGLETYFHRNVECGLQEVAFRVPLQIQFCAKQWRANVNLRG